MTAPLISCGSPKRFMGDLAFNRLASFAGMPGAGNDPGLRQFTRTPSRAQYTAR